MQLVTKCGIKFKSERRPATWTKHYDGDGPGGSVLPLGGAGSIDEQQVGYVWALAGRKWRSARSRWS